MLIQEHFAVFHIMSNLISQSNYFKDDPKKKEVPIYFKCHHKGTEHSVFIQRGLVEFFLFNKFTSCHAISVSELRLNR